MSRRNAARARYSDGCQLKVDRDVSIDVDLHLLRIFVEWLRAADGISVCLKIIRSRGYARETITTIGCCGCILRCPSDFACADADVCIGDRLARARVGDDAADRG